MTTDPIDSLLPINSATQSFVRSDDTRRGGWHWVTSTECWSQASRLKGMLVALLVTFVAYWVWRRTGGYLGYSMFALLATGLLYGGIRLAKLQPIEPGSASSSRMLWSHGWILLGLGIACLRMIWQGNYAVAFFAVILLGMFSLCLHGRSFALGRSLAHPLFTTVDGAIAWIKLYDCIPLLSYALRRWPWMVWGIPMFVGFAFLIPLTLAHPYLITCISQWASHFWEGLVFWFTRWNFSEIFILACVAAMSMGMVLPTYILSIESSNANKRMPTSCSDVVYAVIRNTLIAVIVIFSIFLVYEFSSLWFRTFPENFHYSGYAHQGAAWLTIALAMSTVALSIMFSPSTHLHPQISLLQGLAKLWFVCNLLLVIAVYYRLAIYVGFNGLTRMRIVGYVGVTCVLAGFVLVLYRVLRSRSLEWLIQRQVWAFAISIFCLSVIPMDWIAHRWNVNRIAAGRMAPAVQIAAHPISDEGLLCLFELVDLEEPLVRNGVLALLAKREIQRMQDRARSVRTRGNENASQHSVWGDFQGSTHLLEQKYPTISSDLQPFRESLAYQESAWRAFREWAMQWY